MCCICRWIDMFGRALRQVACCASLRPFWAVCGVAILLAPLITISPVYADGFSNGPALLPVTAPTAPTYSGGTLPSTNALRQATHQEPEPARLISTGNDKPILLPEPPHDLTGERPSSGPRTLGAIVSVIVSLAVVLGLFFVIAWLMRRSLPNSAQRLPTEAVEILGRTPLAGRQQMHLLRFGNKMLLVCVSPTGVDTLGEITDPVEIDRMAGLCAQTQSSSASAAFKQIFGQLTREKSPAALTSGNGTRTTVSRQAMSTAGEAADV
jgi:flagellar biogenesis protein FliO